MKYSLYDTIRNVLYEKVMQNKLISMEGVTNLLIENIVVLIKNLKDTRKAALKEETLQYIESELFIYYCDLLNVDYKWMKQFIFGVVSLTNQQIVIIMKQKKTKAERLRELC